MIKKALRKSRPRLNSDYPLKHITIGGYKSIREKTTLKLAGLNVIAGANSAGKSSFMQPLLLLKQTMEAGFDPGPLLLDGPHVRFTELSQFLSKSKRGQQAQLSIELSIHSESNKSFDSIEFQFSKKPGTMHKLQIDANVYKTNNAELILNTETTRDQCLEWLTNSGHQDRFEKTFFNSPSPFKVTFGEDRFFISCFDFENGSSKNSKHRFKLPVFQAEQWRVSRPLLNMIHAPGLRGHPDRTYRNTAVGDRFPGPLDDYVASIIHHWIENGDERLVELGEQLKELGLTWKVDASKVDATRIELKVGRLTAPVKGGAKDLVSIVDVGFGVSQVMPVLVGLLVARPDQLVYIEQPEIHLHPKAQRALAGPFAAAVKRGVQVVVETHSPIFLTAIQTLVAKGELSPGLVKLHWVSRDSKGETQLSTHDLDETGAYGDWPQDFDDVESEVATDYYTAAEKILLKK